MTYKTVFFDANLTLWHWDYDPALVLLQAIKAAGGDIDELELRRCYDTLRATYARK